MEPGMPEEAKDEIGTSAEASKATINAGIINLLSSRRV
jgi:hypothetical protein